MWGEILGSLFGVALESANNDADNETKRIQSQYQLAIEQEKTRQQKEATKRDAINNIINGIFNVLGSAANSTNSKNSGSNRD